MLDADSVRRAANLLQIVQSYGIEMHKSGSRWFGICPWHKDSTPSFTVYEKKGVLRCGCFGCNTLRDGDVIDFVGKMDGIDFQGALKRVSELSGMPPVEVNGTHKNGKPKSPPKTGKTLATYQYVGEEGELPFQVLRKEVLDDHGNVIPDKKTFLQRQPDGHGGWIWNITGVRKVLYNLPSVLQSDTVFIVEGEKDVHTLTTFGRGITATTNAGGARAAWEPQYTECLADKHVIVCGDTDDPGKARDAVILQALAGVASLRRIELPTPLKDVSDFFAAGNTFEELMAMAVDCEIPGAVRDQERPPETTKDQPRDQSRPEEDPIREEAPGDWRRLLLVSKDFNPKASIANVITALRGAPEWKEVLWYSEFAGCVFARAPFPGQPNLREDTAWSDTFDTMLTDWLHHQGISISTDISGKAVQLVATDHNFHPVKDYLSALEWDAMPRLDNWLIDYLGAKGSNYISAVGSKWMISAVARIFEPGCKADCCLVLEGEQGMKKSTALRTLASNEWFTDEIADLGSKDAGLQMQNVWIVELSELDALKRSEISRIKAFMSRSTDRFRPPYGRRTVEFPRQCVFAASTNQETYLADDTGNRRFWPVRCRKIDIAGLSNDRDQLWAEAVLRYRDGEQWWLEGSSVMAEASIEQSKRHEDDPWQGKILIWLNSKEKTHNDVTAIELLESCIVKPAGMWTIFDKTRMERCLRLLQWTNEGRGDRYYRPGYQPDLY